MRRTAGALLLLTLLAGCSSATPVAAPATASPRVGHWPTAAPDPVVMQEKAFLVKVHKYVPAGEPGGSDVTVVRSGYLLCAALKRGDITERDVTFYQVAEVTGKWATAVAVDYDALCPDWYKG